MKKEFILNIIFLVVANLLIKPLYLLWVEVEVNNIVGPSTYGIYASIFSLCYIFQIIADPGLLNYNTTQISSNRNLVYKRFPMMLGLKLILAIVFILFMYIIASFLGYSALQWSLLPWIISNILLISLNLFFRSNISSLGKYRWDSFFSILDKSLMIIILVYLIYYSKNHESFTILDFVMAQTAAYFITSLLLSIFIGISKISIIPSFDFGAFAQIVKRSLPFAWLLFLMTVYTRVDSFMLERLLEDNGYQAGVYASAFRLYDAGNSFSYLVAVLLLPMFANMLSEKTPIKPLFYTAFNFVFAGLIAICFNALFYAESLMKFFYPTDATEQYGIVFSLLLLSLIPLSLAYISGTLLTAGNHLKKLNQLAFTGVVINIILNILLIPIYQSNGAATATLVTQSVMTLVQFIYIYKIFKFTSQAHQILKYISFCLLVYITAYVVKISMDGTLWLNLMIGIIISLIIALIFRIIDVKSFLIILKKRIV